MALIVEDGTGLAAAESYASASFADSYFAGRLPDAEWVDKDAEEKERALRRAADYMVQRYRMRWLGYRAQNAQRLDWPRGDVPKPDTPGGYGGYPAYYAHNVVPELVMEAQCELAVRHIAGTVLSPDLGPPVLSKSVGPITITYADGARQTTEFRSVDMILSPLLEPTGSSSMRLVRA